ncbi:hypothetical protein FISHEDRAFT_76814 [Fistulina hepatica ATCC 64428]|uniref:Uncharacterized protein n=1 Tax=Fistulina hepatica ATCC 64428 TaxID=1128425 RepID=A0A0D7A2U4_9AGAR|nr:hypothetical protein FISHEDRAFT_76814 [Fistulina hepatica ATCC 64428]
MSTPSVSCIPSEEGTLIAMLLIAALLCMALWGVATSQLVKYYELYPKDRWQLKVYVAAAWTVDTLAMAFITYYLYVNTVTTLSDCSFFYEYTSYIGVFAWNILFVPASLFTQIFYLHRIWMFGRESTTLNRALFYSVVSFIALSMTVQSSLLLYLTVLGIQDPGAVSDIETLLYTGSMSAVITSDLLLTLSLVYLLLRYQTGALSLTLAITAMTLRIVTSPSTGYSNLFTMPLTPVYLISLLASLNIRQSLRDAGQINNTMFSLPAMSSGGATNTGGISHAQNSGVPSGSIHFAPNPETTKSTNVVGSSSEQV